MEILGLIFLFVLMAVFSIGFGTLLAVTTSETKTIAKSNNTNTSQVTLKSLDVKMCIKYKLKNSEGIKFLCDLIIYTTQDYNKQYSTRVVPESVATIIFHRFINDIPTITKNDISNTHLGYIMYIRMCCCILSDTAYVEQKYELKKYLKEDPEESFHIEGYTDDELLDDLFLIMDESYIDLINEKTAICFNSLSDVELDKISLNDFSEKSTLYFGDVSNEALVRFYKKYNIYGESEVG